VVIPLVIRQTSLADAPAVTALLRELGYPAEPDRVASTLRRLLDDPSALACVPDRVNQPFATMTWLCSGSIMTVARRDPALHTGRRMSVFVLEDLDQGLTMKRVATAGRTKIVDDKDDSGDPLRLRGCWRYRRTVKGRCGVSISPAGDMAERTARLREEVRGLRAEMERRRTERDEIAALCEDIRTRVKEIESRLSLRL